MCHVLVLNLDFADPPELSVHSKDIQHYCMELFFDAGFKALTV